LANYWQLNWIYRIVGESGRAGVQASYGVREIAAEFIGSFQFSYVVHLYLIYLAVTLFFLIIADLSRRGLRGKPVGKALWFSLIVTYLIFVDRYSWAWLGEDLAYWKERWLWSLFGLCGFLFCYVLLMWRYLKKSERNASLLFFQYPATFLLALYFMFENPRLFNWGPGEIERLPFIYVGVLVLLLFFSVFSIRERSRVVALAVLSAIYLLRCHFQLLSLRILGMPWYDQRDDIYILFFFSVLIVLGWLRLIHLCRRHFRAKYVVFGFFVAGLLGVGNGFHDIYEHSPLNPAIYAGLRNDVEHRRNTVRYLMDKYAPDTKYARVSLPDSLRTPPGSMLAIGVSEVSIYGSTVPKYHVNYVEKRRKRCGRIASKCRLPYLWLPNNIHRVLNCSFEDRIGKYNSYIKPNLDYYRHFDILELLGVQFIFTDKMVDFPYLKLLKVAGRDLVLYKVLSKTSDRPFNVGRFLAASGNGEASCEWKEDGNWKLVNIETDLMGDKPVFRDRYRIGFDAPQKGCLLISWTYSKLWSFNVNGRDVVPRLGDTMFMVVPVERGENRILAHYHPKFKWHLAFSLGVTLLGIVWAVRFYLRNKKQRRGRR
jgi:hypothetical protein